MDTLVNSVGLACDIAGVLLLSFFALPPMEFDNGSFVLFLDDKKALRNAGWTRKGLILAGIGFGLQLLSNFL